MSEPGVVGVEAWHREPPLVDETTFTAVAEPGWSSWNNMSPEREFCELAAQLVRTAKPRRIVETGVGQGFTTRRILDAMGDDAELRLFESDTAFAELLRDVPMLRDDDRVSIPERASPDADDLAWAELTVLDSRQPHRTRELERWAEVASGGTLLLVHDVKPDHPAWTNHHKLALRIDELGIPGVFLPNPRGGFLGQRRLGRS